MARLVQRGCVKCSHEQFLSSWDLQGEAVRNTIEHKDERDSRSDPGIRASCDLGSLVQKALTNMEFFMMTRDSCRCTFCIAPPN